MEHRNGGPRVRLLRRTLLSLACLGVALLVAEWVVARAYPVLSTNYRPDRELLHTTIPGSRRIQIMQERAGGARVLVRINSDGYRGGELESPRRRPRIAVIGDSLVMAGNVAEPDTFPVRLAAELEGTFEVVNAGLESYGPDQSLLKLEREFEVLAPDLVLLVLCATNDFGDLVRNKLFRLGRGGRLVRAHPVLGDRMVALFERHRAQAARPALVRAWIHLLRTRAARRREAEEAGHPAPDFIPEYLQALRWQYENTVVEQDPRVHDLQQDIYDADVAILPEDPSSKYKRRLLAAVLSEMARSCARRRVPLVAVIVPSAVDLDPDFRIRVDPARYPTYSPRALTDAMVMALDRAGVPHLDLFAVFEANRPQTLFVGWEDIHWNERGIELGAREAARWLAEQGVLPR